MNRSITSNGMSRVKGRLKAGVLCSFTVLAASAASTCGPAPNVLDGTWYGTVNAPGGGSFPAFNSIFGLNVNVRTTFRMVVSESGGNFVEQLELCKLDVTSTTSGPNVLVTTFNPAVLASMVGTASMPTYTPTVGGPVTIAPITIQTGSNIPCTGSCGLSDFVDSDHDSKTGISITANILGTPVEALSALTIPTSITSATLTDTNTIDGSLGFSAHGQIWQTNNASYPPGVLTVTTDAPTTPFTAKKLAGNVPCSTVVVSP
jgi:hypothetical protein